MPIPAFDGKTFLAFVDISGFKQLMKKRQDAIEALNVFYSKGYNIINDTKSLSGIMISDCAIIFVNDQSISCEQSLKILLKAIDKLNRELLKCPNPIMLTTSIAFGEFNYRNKIEFARIIKNPIMGSSYIDAFYDNDSGKPRIQPGECRILIKNLPADIDIHSFEKMKKTNKHWKYYWMVSSNDDIDEFEDAFNDSYQLKYRGMLDALKAAIRKRPGSDPFLIV
ncbi:MAG TPA: hypothetical protein VM658_17650 [bacterium]|nr:hypothetical protein [bacterium]